MNYGEIHTRTLPTFPKRLSLAPLVVLACGKEYLLGLQGELTVAPLGARLSARCIADVVVRRLRHARAKSIADSRTVVGLRFGDMNVSWGLCRACSYRKKMRGTSWSMCSYICIWLGRQVRAQPNDNGIMMPTAVGYRCFAQGQSVEIDETSMFGLNENKPIYKDTYTGSVLFS